MGIEEKLNKYGYLLIEDEETYWKEFKKWKRKLNKLKPTSPEVVNRFEKLLEEGVKRELISKEYKKEKMNKIYKEVGLFHQFKGDVKDKKQYIKDKAKNLFKRNKK